jgi:hypothetical protein
MIFLFGWALILVGFLIGYILRGILIVNLDDEKGAFEDRKKYEDWRG